jgi:hypothetical protein
VNIVPNDEMTVEATMPHSRLKPPFTETLAIFAALVIRFFLKARLHADELKNVVCEGVYHFRFFSANLQRARETNLTFLHKGKAHISAL